MKRLAIIGASGMLGKSLLSAFAAGYEVIGTYHQNPAPGLQKLDITSPDEYLAFLNEKRPDIVIHAAALTDLERCEHHPEEAEQLNVKPLEVLAGWAQKNQARAVLISTDGVFDGERGWYREDDAPNPLNVYGMTKWKAEKWMSGVRGALILRVAVLYSTSLRTKKFIGNAIAKLRDGQTVRGTNDLIRSPTLTDDVANAARALLERGAEGTYHVTGPTAITMFDAAKAIARIFGYDAGLVEPMTSADIASIVRRPRDCSMDCTKLRSEGIQMRSLEEGLRYIKESLGSQTTCGAGTGRIY